MSGRQDKVAGKLLWSVGILVTIGVAVIIATNVRSTFS
jgi:hypothetical protein